MTPSSGARWLLVVAYGIAMAYVEAACVYYLRVIVGAVDFSTPAPLSMPGLLGAVEIGREFATLVMLLAVGWVAGRTTATRLGYTAIAFGIWDIFYYVFLVVICDWPQSLLDWDLLFLLPLPWWGPVVAPVCIALLMVAGGTLVTQSTETAPGALRIPTSWPLSCIGLALALYAFMADSLRLLLAGSGLTPMVVPASFNWPAFAIALTLLAAPLGHFAWRLRTP